MQLITIFIPMLFTMYHMEKLAVGFNTAKVKLFRIVSNRNSQSLICQLFKPGVHGQRPRTWFLEIALVPHRYACVCVSVCPSPRALISGVI